MARPTEVALYDDQPQTRAGWSTRKTLGVAGLAAGGVSLLLGVGFHVARESRADDFRSARCGTDNLAAIPGCGDTHAAIKSAETMMAVGYVGALLLAGAGGYLWWSDTGASRSSSVALTCVPGSHEPGIVCGGRF